MNPDFTHERTAPASDTSGEQDVTIRVNVRAMLPPGLEQPGDMIGRYKLIEPLGEGGFGSVWRAEQFEPIHREVALKVIKAGMDSREIIARFEAERQALAMMDHPNIAAVLDAGTTESGRPFFSMELVKGMPLTEFCDARKLTIRQRLELFIPVCQAVQHAHQKAILHRDLKPSNILVSEVDGKPVPKVIDFGIAKALGGAEEQAFQASLARTQAGMIIGTPQYMSPEQAGAEPDLDTRSDIYTLGVILYELLVGDTPLGREQLRKAAMDEIMRLVREMDAKRPSSRLLPVTEAEQTAAQNRQSDTKRLTHALRGDLDWIVLKAREKDRSRRYETANALALDLLRHLNDEPVSAGPPSAGYRLRKLARRHKGSLAAFSTIMLMIVAGLVSSLFFFFREKEARVQAQAAERSAISAARRSSQIAKFMTGAFDGIKPEEAKGMDTKLMKKVLDHATKNIGEDLKEQPEVEAELRQTIGRVYQTLGLYDDSVLHFQETLKLRRRVLGADHEATLSAMHNLALAYKDKGNLKEAESMFREVLEKKARIGIVADASTWTTMNCLAELCRSQGRLKEAGDLYSQVLDGRKRTFGDEHPDTLNAINNMGMYYWSSDDLPEAERLFRMAAEGRQRILGEEHPATLTSRHNLAQIIEERGRLREAECLMVKVLEASRRIMGEQHPDTLSTKNGLAQIYDGQGRLDEAEKLYTEILETSRRVVGDEHPDTLIFMHNLAGMHSKLGRIKDAEGLYTKALEVGRRVLGNDHPNTLASITKLAAFYRKQDRLQEAAELYSEAVEGRRRLMGTKHPDTLVTLSNLAGVYARQGKAADAERRYLEVLTGRRSVLPEGHENTLKTLGILSDMYREQKRWSDAEPLYAELANAHRTRDGGRSPIFASTATRLGEVRLRLNRLVEAESILREALQAHQAVGGGILAICHVKIMYGDVLIRLDRKREAKALLAEALQSVEAAAKTAEGTERDNLRATVKGLETMLQVLGSKS